MLSLKSGVCIRFISKASSSEITLRSSSPTLNCLCTCSFKTSFFEFPSTTVSNVTRNPSSYENKTLNDIKARSINGFSLNDRSVVQNYFDRLCNTAPV